MLSRVKRLPVRRFPSRFLISTSRRLLSNAKSDDLSKQPALNQFQAESSKQASKLPEPAMKTPPSTAVPPVFFQSDIPPQTYSSVLAPQTTGPQNNQPNESEKVVKQFRSEMNKLLVFIGVALSFTGYDIYKRLFAENTEYVSEETLAHIEKAIEAETNNRIDDAISHYIDALKQLDSEELEHISPCYTSCSVRIAELFEHEKKFDKALLIYKELSNSYLNAFTHREDFDALSDDSSYDFAILRSLTIAIRYAYLLPAKDVDLARETLMFHIVEAQKRVIEAYPPFLSVLNDINNRNVLDLITADLEKTIAHLPESEQEKIIKQQAKTPIELPLFTTEQTPENKILGLHVKAWPVFTRVLINAKDLYANLSIEANDLSAAISNLTSNSIIIQRCFDHPSRLTLTLTKLGVALQMTYQTISRDFPKGKEIEIIQDSEPVKVNLSSPELKDFVLNTTVSESKRIFLKVLVLCDTMKKQEKIIKANHLGQDIGQWEAMFKPALDKSEMVSAASLGMISYQSGFATDALKYFKRAKVLAFRLNDKDYIDDINEWIKLIEN
ncbi:hypothetical protein PICMEDRAFT_18123 [Pichia membranifaciens NRRL Y-2026]|uniref:Uncharacterized protein n=1 Tax=Pichia membranifaciens NRRL Y-2026 TaxID=763406 RepID=A0A1E3NF57_9ASCO|nr:hypothetical protein PICMEDRAFT_18123 [Pichia membranifaciens NRRL Y-2026]ODQ44726.1 hypothetical protein PICMEDRAFT_18123 [Pichia membranifaciens NRRL Y-2026]